MAFGRARAEVDAAGADSAGTGWRTSAGVISAPAPIGANAGPHLEFHTDELRPRWHDVAFVAAVAAGGVILANHDRELTNRWTADDSAFQRDLARIVRPLGYQVIVAGGAAAWGGAWLSHRAALFVAVQRVDLAIASTAACTFALKEVVGRKRPDESPGNARVFDPFSGHDSFPSGHATLAFATATVLDRETTSSWVPAVAYPLAGLVAWSRVHDRKHWASDVLAGGAIGFGIAWKAENIMRPRAGESIGARVGLEVGPPRFVAVRARW